MNTVEAYESDIENRAAYFTAIRGAGGLGAKRIRTEHPTKAAAIAQGSGDNRTMIYAVTPEGRFAHLCNV